MVMLTNSMHPLPSNMESTQDHDDWSISLRRLFRPPLDDMPTSEQLKYYHKRDFIPSHLFRLGLDLFGKNPQEVRKRIIEASRPATTHDSITRPSDRVHEVASKPSALIPSSISSDHYQVDSPGFDYKKWVAERKKLRNNLEHFGDCEKWLMSKNCTDVESSVLEQFKMKKKTVAPTDDHSITHTKRSLKGEDKLSLEERNRLLRLEKRQLMKDLQKLENFVKLSRTRLAGFYVYFEQRQLYRIPREIVAEVFERIRAPVEPFVIDILCDALENRRMIDYRLVFHGDYPDLVQQYMERLKSNADLTKSAEKMNAAEKDGGIESMSSSDGANPYCMSTMSGECGAWARRIKEESLKQYEKLMEFCLEQDIVLNRSLVERGLLLPTDSTRKQCLSQLRQAGADAPLRAIVQPRVANTKGVKESENHDIYGWQYKELRGTKGPKKMKLPTGVTIVKPKTDCWLTYNEFQDITDELQSRPDFNYKYHGLPPNSAFWPGALLDKLRLHLPEESLQTKPYSLYNIFHPVTSTKVYNPSIPVDRTKGTAWPVNSAGYVQLGPSLARTKKTFAL